MEKDHKQLLEKLAKFEKQADKRKAANAEYSAKRRVVMSQISVWINRDVMEKFEANLKECGKVKATQIEELLKSWDRLLHKQTVQLGGTASTAQQGRSESVSSSSNAVSNPITK